MKEAYKAAFDVMKTQKEICNKFDEIGLNFEYGIGFMGTSMEDLLNHSYTIIKHIMGFKTKTLYRNISINGIPQTVEFDVLYVGDYDEKWAITEDDFSDFVHIAVDSRKMQDMFWNAMMNRDEDVKTRFNQISKNFKIGRYGEQD